LKQLASIPAYAMDIPVKDFAAGMADFMVNPIPKIKLLMSSEMMKARYEVGFERDIIRALQKKTHQKLAGSKTISDFFMLSTKLGDAAAILIGGWGVYKYHYKKLRKSGMSHEDAKRIAIQRFELATKRSQQAGDVEDLADIQRRGSFAKLWTMFMTAPNQYYRSLSGGVRNLFAGRGSKIDNMKRIFIAHVVLPVTFQWVASGFPGLFSDWDDKDTKRMIRAGALGALNGLLIAGDFLEYLGDSLYENMFYPIGQVPLAKPIEHFGKSFQGMKKIADKGLDAELFLEVTLELGNAMGMIIGVPFEAVHKMSKGAKEAAEGENALKALGYSDYTLGNEKKNKKSGGRGVRPTRPKRSSKRRTR